MLYVLLTVAPELPDASRTALVAEATTLWEKAGVRLEWIAGSDGTEPAGSRVRVLVIPKHASTPSAANRRVLGELVSFGRPGAVAIASIDRAESVVTAWRGPASAPPSFHHNRVGVVLGRIVAHEIGHYLLNTRTHARSGLMRASYDIAELLEPRSGAFSLDTDSMAWLQDRVSRGLVLGPVTSP
jgi:hypothetical protein